MKGNELKNIDNGQFETFVTSKEKGNCKPACPDCGDRIYPIGTCWYCWCGWSSCNN